MCKYHDIARDGNLFYLGNAAIGAVNRLADALMRPTSHEQILKEIRAMADKFDPLIEEVAALKTVDASVVKLLERLDEQLADAKDDPQQIDAIRSELATERQRIADAVTAHTPVDSGAVQPQAQAKAPKSAK